MIYKKFEDCGNGKLFITRKPKFRAEPDQILHSSLTITEIKKSGKILKGVNKVKNKQESINLTAVESDLYIIGDNHEEVLKEKVKMIFRFREKIISKHNNIISSLDKELGSTFFECLEENPDIMI